MKKTIPKAIREQCWISVFGKVFEHKRLATGSVVLVSGFAIITNDAVNFISALFASIMTVVFFG